MLGARVRSLLKLKAATDALENSYRKLRELEKVRDDLMKMIVHDLKTSAHFRARDARDAWRRRLRQADRRSEARCRRRRREGGGSARSDRRHSRGRAHRGSGCYPDARADRARSTAAASCITSGSIGFSRRRRTRRSTSTDDAPVFEADKALLKRVFSNLIQNAVSHSSRPIDAAMSARRNRRRDSVHRSPTTAPGFRRSITR